MGKEQLLKIHGVFILIFLILQYVLGMITNLYVQFPTKDNNGQLYEFAWKQIPLASHIIIGIILLISAIFLLFRSIRWKNQQWIIASSIGSLAIIIAGIDGAIFVPTQTVIFSFIMSLSFIIAFISFSWGIYTSKS